MGENSYVYIIKVKAFYLGDKFGITPAPTRTHARRRARPAIAESSPEIVFVNSDSIRRNWQEIKLRSSVVISMSLVTFVWLRKRSITFS